LRPAASEAATACSNRLAAIGLHQQLSACSSSNRLAAIGLQQSACSSSYRLAAAGIGLQQSGGPLALHRTMTSIRDPVRPLRCMTASTKPAWLDPPWDGSVAGSAMQSTGAGLCMESARIRTWPGLWRSLAIMPITSTLRPISNFALMDTRAWVRCASSLAPRQPQGAFELHVRNVEQGGWREQCGRLMEGAMRTADGGSNADG
jgi:hypothetical protein